MPDQCSKAGKRVRVNDRIASGYGDTPKAGTMGRLERQLENGTVLVVLDDGRRVHLASWEIDAVEEAS